jgi:hypothetical protein
MGRTSTSRRRSAEPETLREKVVEMALTSPKDTLAVFVAVAAATIILSNALFLQKGRHPSPMFDAAPNLISTRSMPAPRPRPAAPVEAKTPEAAPTKIENLIAGPTAVPSPVPRPQMPVANASRDPLAGLIASDRRTIAAQKALTEFGFGQIKPTGIVGPETKAAVEKFERERRLPVTGQLSDRVMREIATVTGRALD